MTARIRATLRRLAHPPAVSAEAAAALIVLGWALLTLTAWLTGGLYSPALYAQFVLIALAEMRNGWRWGAATLLLATATVAVLAWAQTRGVLPPSLVALNPQRFASAVALALLALFALEAARSAATRRAHRQLSAELAEREAHAARMRQVIDNAPFGAFVCELDPASELRIAQSNSSAATILRRDPHHIVGMTAEEAFPELVGTPLIAELRSIAEIGGVADTVEEFVRLDGRPLVLDMHCFRIAPRTLGVFFTDVTEQRRAEAAIRHAAFHDDLTGLPNRKRFVERLGSAFSGSRGRDNHVALLFIDLDRFKPINDEHGHAFGDAVLSAVARRLLAVSRVSDTVARFGGDEFAILIPDVETAEQAERAATALLEAFREPFEVHGRRVTVTLSIGIALTSAEQPDPATLLDRADLAMYQMKHAGRDGYRLWGAPHPAPVLLARGNVG